MKVAYESKVNASREPAAPINVHVLALLDDVDQAVEFADGRTINDLVKQPPESFVIWHAGREQPVYLDGVERALRIRKVHAKVSDLVGFAPVFQRRHAPCPRCNMLTLGQWSGSDVISCSNEDCLADYTKDQYEKYCAEKAKS